MAQLRKDHKGFRWMVFRKPARKVEHNSLVNGRSVIKQTDFIPRNTSCIVKLNFNSLKKLGCNLADFNIGITSLIKAESKKLPNLEDILPN